MGQEAFEDDNLESSILTRCLLESIDKQFPKLLDMCEDVIAGAGQVSF